ncbi:Group II intron maturase-specific domain protein [Thermoanaerobacter ethanolicus JW 200]|nr:Group II intron maturase-specific domain protein [Thermoanaerobacter ethanolicus JW 200]
MKTLDEWIRRRLRACIWKQWKKIKTKHDNLVKLGVEEQKAWEYANTRKGDLRISNSPILNKTLTNKYFESIGYKSLSQKISNCTQFLMNRRIPNGTYGGVRGR